MLESKLCLVLAPPAGSQSIMVVFKIQDVALGRHRVSCESDGQPPPPAPPRHSQTSQEADPGPGFSPVSRPRGAAVSHCTEYMTIYFCWPRNASGCPRGTRKSLQPPELGEPQSVLSKHLKHRSNPRPYFWIQFRYLFSGWEVWLNLECRSYSARAKLLISGWLDSIDLAFWG